MSLRAALQYYDGPLLNIGSGHIADEVGMHRGECVFGVNASYGPGMELFNRNNLYPDPGPDYPRWMSLEFSVTFIRWWWSIALRLNKETRTVEEKS